MVTKEGFNDKNEHCWKLVAACYPALQISVLATDSGLLIAGCLISWGDLEIAKREAQKNLPF
ncbi:MAG: hypothetical protein HRU77_06220 [Gammaproteobacteria bacterium]|nr:MAG: hypothetical protein HRU77_06220 [Gammaproteobacteria bacterium]